MPPDQDGLPTPTVPHFHAQSTSPSASAAPTSDVSLSSTTIVALGMGFIGAALLVVGLTVLLRVGAVARAVRRERAQGEDITFRTMWRRYGGAWGLLFAPAQDDQWTPVRVRRRKVGPTPKMWDVDVAKLKPEDEFDLDSEESQPLAAAPYYAPGASVPECAFSVLVVMPTPPHPPPSPDNDDEPSLPDIMLGTTHLQPTIPLADAGIKDDAESEKGSEFEYVVSANDLMRARSRREVHWTTVWGMDASGRM
ncbi:hypothetical protein CcaverHIS002_0407200 [Cutaneotrichosporon cavernicola]|uniref:Uncharacterized protein n=1 Tax=Cutaneotrichosporon cavernicola TaxID=279322 RepID=A0AA48L4N4_9TREE|nr:uncharacterized protein CcaverHIS019_0407210 [Cutaneotrichosporon cavernicola]BEI84116.1 hypothetical protein CcaverHIS002_0407200 [Cutaneotrichosporon cavernicola]BEI91901.1 hypothetical protein CcaverHIS019_0407210 [Cutaneotrichosporon cavernicola]BEI99672.1 hypothetical protein CcaverHIS631_0407150 [Cutaneotrichosporon cavernicola]BEJ07447.1 hypothetical protein CcaverHIS641_0407160 [Cutaneotrichosporon cavernicola]